MAGLKIESVRKTFGDVIALDSVDLDILEGELFFLLGASGCGKTTLLRILAGFSSPDSGTVRFREKNLLEIPVEKRGIGMVFQNYSLWPHMTVANNVAYGLRRRKIDKATIDSKVKSALEMVDMANLGDRKPAALSGGQQQRVALARALVYEPELLLLDEPLSNLDAKLRQDMRAEIRDLHKRLDITMVYVTHDQEEAAALADRIALMNEGRVVQVGTPENVYRQPETLFAANFFGRANVIHGQVTSIGENEISIRSGSQEVKAFFQETPPAIGSSVAVIVRPEDVLVGSKDSHSNVYEGSIEETEYAGSVTHCSVKTDGFSLSAMVTSRACKQGKVQKGDRVHVGFGSDAVHLIKETQK